MNILEVKDLKKSFLSGDQKISVLRGIDFSMEEGEIVVLLGRSGSGKSTFLHIAGGLDEPSAGTVRWKGEDIYALPERARICLRNKEIGFVFQEFYLVSELNALENIRLPFDIAGDPYEPAYEREVIEMLHLTERLKFYPGQLSGGERQRVAAARALVRRPSLVLMDEPTGNLDSKSSSLMMDFVAESNRKNRQTFLIVTHDREWLRVADRTLRMRDGKLLPEVIE